jgi:hypothetical protein
VFTSTLAGFQFSKKSLQKKYLSFFHRYDLKRFAAEYDKEALFFLETAVRIIASEAYSLWAVAFHANPLCR